MIKSWTWVFMFFFNIGSCLAVQTDSLLIYREKYKQARQLINKGKYLSSVNVFKKSLSYLSDKQTDRKIEILYLIGNAYQEARVLDSTEFYYKKADKLCDESVSDFSKSLKYRNRASLHFARQKIDSSMINALKAVDYALLSENKKQIIKTHVDVGQIFLSQKDFRNAEAYFIKAHKWAVETNDSIKIAFAQTYLGQLAMEQGNHDLAEQRFLKAIPIFEKELHYKGIILSKGHLSKSYFFQGKSEAAIKIGYQLMPILNEIEFRNDLQKLISNTNDIINVENNTKLSDSLKIEKGTVLVEKSFQVIENSVVNVAQNQALVKYAQDNKRDSDFNYASDLNEKGLSDRLQNTIRLQDSIYQASLENRYAEIEAKYQNEINKKDNLELKQINTQQELTLEKENKRKWILALSLIASLLALTVFWFFYRKNKKQNNIIENLQKEMHHRVKNNLAIIDSFIEVTKEGLHDSNIESKLVELQNRIDSINQIHNQLYKGSDVSQLNVKSYVNRLVKNVQSSFSENNIHVEIEITSDLNLSPEKSFPIGLIINEFLTNSYKHAFKKSKDDNKIEIYFKDFNTYYYLMLFDNGSGLHKDFKNIKSNSFGIDVMELLTKQLKGDFAIEGEEGVTVTIKFPKK